MLLRWSERPRATTFHSWTINLTETWVICLWGVLTSGGNRSNPTESLTLGGGWLRVKKLHVIELHRFQPKFYTAIKITDLLRPRPPPPPTTLSSPQRTDTNHWMWFFLPGCFLKTFIDIMLFSLLFYVFTFLFTCISSFIHCYFITFSKL